MLGGLRVEDERLSLDQITQAARAQRDNVGVYPTLHLGYRQNANVTWVANYSLRIQRPNPATLNPYRNLTDPVNIQVGNPQPGSTRRPTPSRAAGSTGRVRRPTSSPPSTGRASTPSAPWSPISTTACC